MNVRRIATFVCACALGAVAGHWHARSALETAPAPRVSKLRSQLAPTYAPAPAVLAELERTEPGYRRNRAVYERLAALSVEEAEALARVVAATEHSPSRTTLLGALIERLVDANPRAALRVFDTHVASDDPAHRWLHIAWYRTWLEVDHAAAVRHAQRLPETPERDESLLLAMSWFGADSPIAAQLSAYLSPAARASYTHARAALDTPTLAFERSLREPDPQLRFDALRSSFARLVRDDLGRALQRVERIPEDERDAIVGPALGAWAKHDPERAWDALNRMDLQQEQRNALFSGLAEQEPQAALSWLQEESRRHEGRKRPIDMYRAIVPTLLRDDLSAASSLVAELGRDAPLDLIQQVALAHAKRNPLDGFAWAANLGQRTDYERMQTLQAVSASVVAADPETAAAVLNRTTDAHIRHHLMREIAGHKAQRSVRDAWTWLQTYRGDASYRENARALLSAWSYAKPAEVAAVVLAIDDIELQRGAAEQLSNVWKQRDPNALRHWLATLPPGHLRDALSRQLASG